MKAKFYIGIISALLLAGSPVAAQFADNDFRSDDAGLVVNNYYYDDYDYYFASRINRFHRSFAAFDYYSPVFTETYYYNYRPFSWGISIYGGGGFGFGLGYSYSYPVYSYGWYDPYYGSSWYWDYDPYYYSWYSPVIININVRNRWRPNYWGWHGHDRWYYGYDSWYYGHNRWYNNYRPVYHSYNNNNYYYDSPARYSSRDFPDRKGYSEYNRSNSGGYSRREGAPAPGSRSGFDSNNGNKRNSNTDGNSGNFGNKNNPADNAGKTRVAPTTVQSNRKVEQAAPARNPVDVRRPAASSSSRSGSGKVMSAPSRSSSSSRPGTTMSQGRPSSSSRGTSASSGRSSSSRSSGSKSKSSSSKSSSRSSSESKSRR